MLSNMVVSRGHLNLNKMKLNEIKSVGSQQNLPHFKCSIATRAVWLPYWTVQIRISPSLQKILVDNPGLDLANMENDTDSSHWQLDWY